MVLVVAAEAVAVMDNTQEGTAAVVMEEDKIIEGEVISKIIISKVLIHSAMIHHNIVGPMEPVRIVVTYERIQPLVINGMQHSKIK